MIEELPKSLIDRLYHAGHEARYAADEPLPDREAGFAGIRLIGDGEVTVLAQCDDDEIPVWHYGAGNALGIRDFLRPESEPRVRWRARTDCLVHEIAAGPLRALMREDESGALRQLFEEAAHLRDLEIRMAVHPLFRLLDASERHVLFETATVRALPDGEMLVRAGQPNPALYLIVSGTLAIERNGTTIGARGAGELVGEVSALGFAPTADVRAEGWVELLAFERERILDLCEENSAFAERLAREGLSLPSSRQARRE
ncbi:MAG: cyclic nucleotide-binding domain-containing protein [Mariprofundaceae bacterium]